MRIETCRLLKVNLPLIVVPERQQAIVVERPQLPGEPVRLELKS